MNFVADVVRTVWPFLAINVGIAWAVIAIDPPGLGRDLWLYAGLSLLAYGVVGLARRVAPHSDNEESK